MTTIATGAATLYLVTFIVCFLCAKEEDKGGVIGCFFIAFPLITIPLWLVLWLIKLIFFG